MPFKSKKQKKTIDAAAHNPEFAKKIGIKVADAKKMSKHGKGQTKFEEAKDTVEKDEKGNVKSWKHEGDWEKAKNKEGRGKVTNLSDKARRKTEKLSKAEKEMAESFEQAMEATVTQGPNKGKQWSPKTPGPTNPNYKPFDKNGVPSPDDGATAPPKDYKPGKRADAGDLDDQPAVAETAYSAKAGRAGKDLGKKGKNFEKIAKGAGGGKKGKAIAGKVLKDIRAKHLKESIEYLSQLIQEAKKSKKVDQNNDGKNDFEDVKIARLKAAAKSKSKKVDESKAKCTCEDTGKSKCAVHGKHKDKYMESLLQKLQNQLNG